MALVQLGADESQPLLQAVAIHRAVGGCEVLGRHLVGDELHDGGAFAQALTIVQLQHGHVAQFVDGVEVRAVLQFVRLGAGQHGIKSQAGFVQHDVGRE